MWKKILVAIDQYEPAQRALQTAIDLSKDFNAGLTIICVSSIPDWAAVAGVASNIDSEAQLFYQPLLKRAAFLARKEGVQVQTELLSGHPANGIVRYVKEYPQDLLLLGSKGASTLEKLLLGGVASQVAHQCPNSIMIIR